MNAAYAVTAAVVVRSNGRTEDVERSFLVRLVRAANVQPTRLVAFAARMGALGDRAHAAWGRAEWGSLERRRLHRLVTRAYAVAAHALRRAQQTPRRTPRGLTHRPFEAALCGLRGLPAPLARLAPCPEVQEALELVEAQIPPETPHKSVEGTQPLTSPKEITMTEHSNTTATETTTSATGKGGKKEAGTNVSLEALTGLSGALTKGVEALADIGEALIGSVGEAEKAARSAANAATAAASAAEAAARVATDGETRTVTYAMAQSAARTAEATESTARTLADTVELVDRSATATERTAKAVETLVERTAPSVFPVGWKARAGYVGRFVGREVLRPMAKGGLAFAGVMLVKGIAGYLAGSSPEAPVETAVDASASIV